MAIGETIGLIEALGPGGGGGSNKFIVTLTPTAEDYSGVMDKTLAEISAAYEASCDIVFSIITSENGSYVDIPLSSMDFNNEDENPFYVFHAYFLYGEMLIEAYNIEVAPQTNTYDTNIYALTPAS